MHTHSINYQADRPESDRYLFNRGYFLWAELPTNPVCWLLGHFPRVHVVEPSRPGWGKGWGYIACRVCGNRHTRVRDYAMKEFRPGETATERQARLDEAHDALMAAYRDPVRRRAIERDTDRRSGWDVTKIEPHAQVVVSRPSAEFSLRLHVGGLGSETPWDAHATIAGTGVYAGLGGIGGRLAQWISRGKGADLSAYLHDWTLRWKLWREEDSSGSRWRVNRRGQRVFQSWRSRDGWVSVNLRDHLHGGPLRYSYEDRDEQRTAFVVTTEGTEHMVDFQLQLQTRARPRGPRQHSVTAHWTCEEGIPVRNHEWKGDCTISSAVTIAPEVVRVREQRGGEVSLLWDIDGRTGSPKWLSAAVEALKAQITRDREHYEWNPRLPVNR